MSRIIGFLPFIFIREEEAVRDAEGEPVEYADSKTSKGMISVWQASWMNTTPPISHR
jgi:hypothetical protein